MTAHETGAAHGGFALIAPRESDETTNEALGGVVSAATMLSRSRVFLGVLGHSAPGLAQRGRRLTALALGWALAAAMAAGCGGEAPAGASSSAAPAPSASPRPSSTPAQSASHPTATPAVTGAPAASERRLAGGWKAAYRSEKVNPTIDPTIEDTVWKSDDAKRHVGPGSVELDVGADGTVSGRVEGALGRGDIHGVAEDDALRATIAPTEDGGQGGTLVAKLDGDALAFVIRTSDGEGKSPRIARGKLERRP